MMTAPARRSVCAFARFPKRHENGAPPRRLLAKVLLTPGRDCHMPEPGWFRVCFAAVPPASLEEAGRRLKAFVEAMN